VRFVDDIAIPGDYSLKQQTWIELEGRLIEGHKVASRPSAAYPYGTLDKQRPFFKKLGLDLDPFFNGTLNISIAPRTFSMSRPEITFKKVEWTDLHPPETFSFSRCEIIFRSVRYDGWVYYPHPETKIRHFQDASMLEVIAQLIPGIMYGDRLQLRINPREISLQDANP
jgi:hypothetical protein